MKAPSLYRKGFPRLLCRFVGVERPIVEEVSQCLDSVVTHPILNSTLSHEGISVPQAYRESLLNGLRREFKRYADYIAKIPQ